MASTFLKIFGIPVPRPSFKSYKGGTVKWNFDQDVYQAVKKTAAEQKAKVALAAANAALEVLKTAPAPEKKTAEKLVQESSAAQAAAEQKVEEPVSQKF